MAQNSDTLLFWGCDPEVTPQGFGMRLPTRICYWFTELGIKSIYICPELNYGAAIHADKWIPILPNTDAAMQLAIAYIWLTEGTYDKDYIDKHTYGFDKFVDYVLGKEDGVPKTPKWASEKCGVKPWTIRALAEHWPRGRCPSATATAQLHPRPLRQRARPPGGHAPGHAGPGQARRAPDQDDRVEHVGQELPCALHPEFVPETPHICDATRVVDGDVRPEIQMDRFALSPAQKERAPEIVELFKKLPGPSSSSPAAWCSAPSWKSTLSGWA